MTMATSSLHPSMPAVNQDDWINMLAGMDQFLDEVTDSIPLTSPTLGSIATTELAPSEVPILPPPACSTPATVNHVETSIESTSCNIQPTQQCAEPSTEARYVTKTNNLNKDAISAEAKAQARSERKRTREKQRRLDVNSQIVDLTTLLLKVEADEDEASGDPATCKPCNNPSNRVELISRTISALSKLHNENKKRGRELVDLKSKLDEMKKMKDAAEQEARKRSQPSAQAQGCSQPQKQQSMLMMVPMMVSQDGNFMPQAMQMPMQMQMCPQAMYPTQPCNNAVYPNVVQPNMYYPANTTPTPAPAAPTPVPVQAPSMPMKQSFVIKKTSKQQDKIIGQGYNSVAFDSSKMNLNIGGNLAHCA